MELDQQEIDELWDSVSAFAWKEAQKWPMHKEDFVQYAALNVCEQIKKCSKREDLSGYAMQAIKYTHSRAAKKVLNTRHRLGNCEPDASLNNETHNDASNVLESPYEAVWDSEEVSKIEEAISQIKHEKARIAVGHVSQGSNMRKTAKLMGISHQRVQQLIKKAREELEVLLGSYYIEYGS